MHQFEIAEHVLTGYTRSASVLDLSLNYKKKSKRLKKKLRKFRKKIVKLLFGKPKRSYTFNPAY